MSAQRTSCQNFFSSPLNVHEFFLARWSCARIVFLCICTCRIFFFKITPPPPPPQKSNGRPLKCLHNFAPSYLSNLIVKYTPNRALRSSSKNLLVVPPSRTKGYGDRAFSICGPKLWNSLPDSLRHETKLEHFKKNLKTYLF